MTKSAGRPTMRRRLPLLLGALIAASGVVNAHAFWASTDSSNHAAAVADALQQGSTPTVSATGPTSVEIDFTRASTSNGREVVSYLVKRYDSASATTESASFSCDWPAATTLSCSEPSLPEGTWYYTNTTRIAGSLWMGTESTKSTGVTIDTIAPAAPSTPDLATASDTGTSSTDNLTSADTPTFTGTAEAEATVKIYAGAVQVGSGTATGGNYTIQVSALAQGAHTITATATDGAGNVSSASSGLAVTIDTSAPAAPSIPDLATASDTGTSSTDNLTNVDTPTFTGTAETGATVTIYAGAVQEGSGTATGGNYTIQVSALGEGAHTITATATDGAGNVSTASSGLTVTIDTSAPAVPSIPDLATASDTGSSSTDNLTNIDTPTFTGTADSGSTVKIFAGAVEVGSGTATGGNYSIQVAALGEAAHAITARASDGAGNTSSPSGSLGVTVDTTAPLVAATTIAKQTGYLAGSIKQSGSYYVYANVTETGGGVLSEVSDVTAITTGSAVTLAGGSYSANGLTYNYRSALQTATSGLTSGNGTRLYSIVSTDLAGNNRTQTSLSVTVDNTVPAGSNVQTANGGSTPGRAEATDSITFTFSEQIDPHSIVSGWTGASTNVVVRLIDGGCTLILCSDDSFQIFNASNSAALPFGTVDLNQHNYHGGGLLGAQPPLTFGASGTPSTMVQSGASIAITLGTASGTADTGSSTTMEWLTSTAPYDAAGNALSGTDVDEGGAGDREF
ncbi:MAG: Ig-like domain-containing protein [Actinomycetota bacterium]